MLLQPYPLFLMLLKPRHLCIMFIKPHPVLLSGTTTSSSIPYCYNLVLWYLLLQPHPLIFMLLQPYPLFLMWLQPRPLYIMFIHYTTSSYITLWCYNIILYSLQYVSTTSSSIRYVGAASKMKLLQYIVYWTRL